MKTIRIIWILMILYSLLSCSPSAQEKQEMIGGIRIIYMKDGTKDTCVSVYVDKSGGLDCYKTGRTGFFQLPDYHISPYEYIKVIRIENAK